MGNPIVKVDPEKRETLIKEYHDLKNIPYEPENVNGAYLPIALTNAHEVILPWLQGRQDALINKVLEEIGISQHDPAKDELSPHINPDIKHKVIYRGDTEKILRNRYFIGHNILPSTGVGVEMEKASRLYRVGVILMDKGIRVSTMLPDYLIYLQYDRFHDQAKDFIPVIEMLQQFDPGVGLEDGHPVLLGFEKNGPGIINLEKAVYEAFPHLKYDIDAKKPVLNLKPENIDIFSEYHDMAEFHGNDREARP